MKIREGAYYRTRDGDVVGPMRRTKDQCWYSSYHTWNEDGGIYLSGAAHGLDLISEVYVSDTPPADTPSFIHPILAGPSGPFLTVPEAKTLRDEFAMAALNGAMVGYHDKPSVTCDNIAKWSYNLADAMMEARKK